MEQNLKELLLRDLCARLPYKVKFKGEYDEDIQEIHYIKDEAIYTRTYPHLPYWIETIKPYLRPMSSMTKEERKELNNQGYTKIAGELYHYCALSSGNAFYNPERHSYVRMEYVIKLINWLDKHHFDYRGLIDKGLALVAPEGMYNIKEK